MNNIERLAPLAPYSSLPCVSEAMVTILNRSVQMFGTEAVPIGSLLQMIFSTSLLVRRYLNVPDDVLPLDAPQHIATTEVRDNVDSLRTRLGHSSVNEMHLLLSIVQAHSSEAAMSLQSLVDAYRSAHPSGSQGQQLIRGLLSSHAPQLLRNAMDTLSNTPFHIDDLAKLLREYLESAFYPYDQESWCQFRDSRLRNWQKGDEVSLLAPLHAFVAHGVAAPF